MAQQIQDLMKLFSDMSSEEQLTHIREIRRVRHIEKPATRRRKAADRNKTVNKVAKALEALPADELAKLLEGMEDE